MRCTINTSSPAPLCLQGKERCTIAEGELYEIDVDAPFTVDSPVTLEVCVLVGMLLLLRLAVYYALVYKTTFKKNTWVTKIMTPFTILSKVTEIPNLFQGLKLQNPIRTKSMASASKK